MRPNSGCSTRSRRDEVWDMKRKRWLARQKNGGYNGDAVNGGGARRPPAMSIQPDAPPRAAADVRAGAPGSPLSRLVAGGYPETQASATTHQPYGDRPPSSGGGAGAGFSGAVAGQWNSNVQQSLQQRQSRLDPNVAGPHIPQGGQRVTQAPGGVASIDLSFANGGGGGGAVPSRTPPRMPGAGQQQQQPQYSQQQAYGQQQQAPAYQQQQSYGNGQQQQAPYNAHAMPAGGGMRAPSPARSGGGRSAAPWGNDENYTVTPTRARQRDSCPFGQDSLAPAGPPVGARRGQAGPGGGIGSHGGFEANAQAAGGQMASRGARGSSPHHAAAAAAAFQGGCGAGAGAPAGSHMGGRGAYGRPPGGGSSLVLG